MGITLRNPSQDDFNQLKKMLADGKMSPQQFNAMPMDVGYDGPPPQLDAEAKNMLAQMMQQPVTQQQMMLSQAAQQSQPSPQNSNYIQVDGGARQQVGASNGPSPQQLSDQASISKNADGVALSKLVAGGGYQNLNRGQGIIRMTQPDGATEDRYINDASAQGPQAAPMKLYGYGNGTLSSLGNAEADASSSADISRNPVDVPGLGKGYYSKDGRSAIITNSDGSKSQVLLGYDRAGSQAIDAYNMQRQKTQGDIAHTSAETDLVNAKVAEYSKPDAGGNDAVSMSEVVDPKDSSKTLRVDARKYKGGTLGDVGVLGVANAPKLAQGERALPDGTVEQIPGSAAYQKQSLLHGKALASLESVNTKNDNAIAKIDDILSDKNKSAFDNNFGGYTALLTNKLPGDTQDVGQKIESIKNDMKSAGLDIMRAGGGIGSMTEKEWPIVQGMIDAINPKLGLDAARKAFDNVKSYLLKIKENAKDVYSNEWDNTQYGKLAVQKASDKAGGADARPGLIRDSDTSTSMMNAQAAIKSGIPRNVVIQRLRAAGIMDNP